MIKQNKLVYPFFLFIMITMVFSPCSPMVSVAFPLSIEDERVMGERFLLDVRKYFEMEEDEFVNDYISQLGHYLIKPLETRPFPFHFYVIRDNSLNAFAGPGGHIFIYSGLIEAVDRVDELAAVICHEIGHISSRHLSQRVDQAKKIGLATMAGVLAGALIGGKASGAIMAGSMAAGAQAQLHYSREDERQADQLSFKYMSESGFDETAIASVLNKLVKGQLFDMDRIPPYLLTHPTGPERMANIEGMMSEYAASGEKKPLVSPFRRSFPFLKTTLRARVMDPDRAEKLFADELLNDPSAVMAHFGLGIVCRERFEYDRAIDHFNKALKGQGDSALILKNLAEAYVLKGDHRGAISILEKALKINDQDKSVLFLLALSYQNLEEYEKATLIYERLASTKPVKNEVYYNLGVSYGRMNRLALAHYNFGLHFEMLKETKKALFHFEKAYQLAGSNSSLRGRIEQAKKGLE